MGALDIDKVSDDLDKMVSRENLKENYSLKPIMNDDGHKVDDTEFQEIKKNVNVVDLLPSKLELSKNNKLLGLLPVFIIRHEVSVELSNATPDLNELHYGLISRIPLLGRYYSDQKKVVLYIKNIKKVDEGNWQKLLTAVYIHELYHAYFKTGRYYTLIVEEPLAELGTLYTLDCMESIGIFDKGIHEYFLKEVSKKTGPIYFYGFGAELYRYSSHQDIGKILEKFKKNCEKILSKKQCIKRHEKSLQTIIAQGPENRKTQNTIKGACDSFYKLCGISLNK